MDADFLDYDALTLMLEKRIAVHITTARKKRSHNEEKEHQFFVAAANEALFVWMLLASRIKSAHYDADKARLIRMIEDLAPASTLPASEDHQPGFLSAA